MEYVGPLLSVNGLDQGQSVGCHLSEAPSLLQAHPDYWQDSVPCDCRIDVPFSWGCWLGITLSN